MFKPVASLSNSAVDTFSQCPKCYFYRYIDPTKPPQEDVTMYYAQYGTLLHWFAEMYPRTNFHHNLPWEQKAPRGGDVLEDTLTKEENDLMLNRKRLGIHSMLAIYHELFNTIDFPDESTETEYYLAGKDFIQSIPDMDWSKVVGLEQEFLITLKAGVTPVKGIIDKVERDGKGLIVTDYKTSKPYSKQASIQKNQLPLYGMACWYLYGEVPYKYRYHFVRFNKVTEVEIPMERLTQVKNNIILRDMQIKTSCRTEKFAGSYNQFYCNNFCGYKRLCSTYAQYNLT